jgi:hypothetical protein
LIGIDRHHFHARQLFGSLHQPDFGPSRPRPRGARKQQCRHHRPPVPAPAKPPPSHPATPPPQNRTGRLLALQSKNHAHEQAGNGDQQNGQHPHGEDLPDQQAGTPCEMPSSREDMHQERMAAPPASAMPSGFHAPAHCNKPSMALRMESRKFIGLQGKR